MVLSSAQGQALAHLRRCAEVMRDRSLARIAEILARAGEPLSAAEAVMSTIRESAQVTLNFHPDRLLPDGRTVAEALLADGYYKSQFETGISNGSRTAFPGGERDQWENTLFGGAYHTSPNVKNERPKYGALDLMRHADGSSPRFGSCYFLLRREVTARCTLTFGDSHLGPVFCGTIERFEPLLAAMLEAAETRGEVLGVSSMTVGTLLRVLSSQVLGGARDPARGMPGRALDDYIEAQVHGFIDLSHDVEALVLDPAFAGTTIGARLSELSERYAIACHYHPGFVLAPSEVPADFRGPKMVPFAERISRLYARVPGQIDAVALGCAAASLHREPGEWRDWGSFDETLQHIKQLWHVLVRFGHAKSA